MKFISVLALFLTASACAAEQDSPWSTNTVDDPSAGKSMVLSQTSSTPIRGESAANDVTPRLEFSCTPGNAEIIARIDWQRFISSFSTEAGFKVDGGRFTWLKWKMDRSEQVTFSPSSADSQKLIGLLSDGSELLVEISPYSEAPVVANFVLTGLGEQLEVLHDSCK